jgi:lysophospholipase L1-like esterase
MESPGEFAIRFEINSRGLRSPEVDYPRTSRMRVLAIGDSFTFGVGAEQDETWPAVLGTLLETSTHEPVEVLNAGVQGWGLAEYWIWLDKEGARYRPDWIVLGVHRSDWTSAFRELVTLDEHGQLHAHPRPESGVGRLKEISAHIPFYETLMNWSALANYAKSALAQRLRGGTTKNLEGGAERRLEERFDEGWVVNEALLRAIEARAAGEDARVAMIFIPTYEHVRSGDAPDAGDASLVAELRFREAMARHTAAHRVPYIDLTPRFRALLDQGVAVDDLYQLGDGHCTPRGYREIAAAALELIRSG